MMFIDPYRLPFCMNCDGLTVSQTTVMIWWHLVLLFALVVTVTQNGGGVL